MRSCKKLKGCVGSVQSAAETQMDEMQNALYCACRRVTAKQAAQQDSVTLAASIMANTGGTESCSVVPITLNKSHKNTSHMAPHAAEIMLHLNCLAVATVHARDDGCTPAAAISCMLKERRGLNKAQSEACNLVATYMYAHCFAHIHARICITRNCRRRVQSTQVQGERLWLPTRQQQLLQPPHAKHTSVRNEIALANDLDPNFCARETTPIGASRPITAPARQVVCVVGLEGRKTQQDVADLRLFSSLLHLKLPFLLHACSF